ncbi:MAG: DUF1152 domain-containing protein [Halobacteriota archaeon]
MIDTLEEVSLADRALVFGIGGGGDVVGAIPSARLLQQFGLEVVLGGVAWQPVPRDVRPGPRSLDELTDVDVLGSHVGVASGTTETVDGVAMAEGDVAALVDEPVLVLDITDGPHALVDSLKEVLDELEIDLVVGVDAGGDVLARGTEPGVRSPLTDATGLVVLEAIARPSLVGVIGYGSDGELTHDELDEALAEVAARDGLIGAWGLTPRVRDELEGILESVETEASRLPVLAVRGHFGTHDIRDGRRTAAIGPASTVTFYLDPEVLADRSLIVEVVRSVTNLEQAASRLHREGDHTELEAERRRLEET